ncbi:MAG: M15 family metallopeptidase [Rikenellaceae bacterium]
MKYITLAIVALVSIFNLSAQVIVDSDITLEQALVGTLAPDHIVDSLTIVDVEYYSDDDKLHRGQIVIHTLLEGDIVELFSFIKERRIPIMMVVPIKFDLPDGNTTMASLNNTYGFHYRHINGSTRLSNHSFGHAIDINPFDNPYISTSGMVLPQGGEYSPQTNPRSLCRESALVQKFVELGWTWGGNWESPKDYMHFEKKLICNLYSE